MVPDQASFNVSVQSLALGVRDQGGAHGHGRAGGRQSAPSGVSEKLARDLLSNFCKLTRRSGSFFLAQGVAAIGSDPAGCERLGRTPTTEARAFGVRVRRVCLCPRVTLA